MLLYTEEMLFQIVVGLIELFPAKEEDTDRMSPRARCDRPRNRTLSRREHTLHVAQKRAKKDDEKQVGRYYKRGTLYDRYTRYDRLENNSPSFWWRAWKKRWKDTAADQYYALELKEYYRDMDSQGSD